MNISGSSATVVTSCSAPMSTADIPVVRLTERKSALTTASSGLRPSSTRPDCTSAARKSAIPATSSPAIISTTMRVSNDQRRQPRRRSKTVTNDRLPRNADTPITTSGYGAPICAWKLCRPPIRSKPALLKAETAWNSADHTPPIPPDSPRNQGSSSRNVTASAATT